LTQAGSWLVVGGALALLLYGCAFDLVHVKQVPTTLDSRASATGGLVLNTQAHVDLGTGFSRTLRQGTTWEHVGSIPQGHVYRTRDQVVTVEASNVHEAYIVVAGNKLVGFYLPVERSFSPLADAVELDLKARASNP